MLAVRAGDDLCRKLHHPEDQMPAFVKGAHSAEAVYCEKGRITLL